MARDFMYNTIQQRVRNYTSPPTVILTRLVRRHHGRHTHWHYSIRSLSLTGVTKRLRLRPAPAGVCGMRPNLQLSLRHHPWPHYVLAGMLAGHGLAHDLAKRGHVPRTTISDFGFRDPARGLSLVKVASGAPRR